MASTLYQFAISHYCEKARFALDYKGADYRTVSLLPGLHVKTTKTLARRSSVPVLVTGDGDAVQGSDAIISHLDDSVPENRLTPINPEQRQRALEWERWLDRRVGVDVRRYCYHHLLPERRISIRLLSYGGPWYGKFLLRLGYRNLELSMRRAMQIDESSAKQSLQNIEQAVTRLEERYALSAFLVGDGFSRADLAAAALLAPLVQPEGYGLVWPDTMPAALEETRQRLEPRLQWIHRIYSHYRSKPKTTPQVAPGARPK